VDRSAPVALFWGDDPFLLRLSALEHLERLGVHATEIDAREWAGGEGADLATPSLWGERRALMVTGCQALSEVAARELRSYINSPSPDATCVLTLVSRAKGPPPLARAVQQAGGLVHHVSLKRSEISKWVVDRARALGVQLSGPAAAALVSIVGEDAARLFQSVEQLSTAFPREPIGPEQVRAQFRGTGEQRVWDLCDRAFEGRLPDALRVLASLLEAREDPLLILGGIASRVRDLLRVRGLPERMPQADAVKSAGLRFDWQLRRYRQQARRFSLEDLTSLHDRVVEGDRALKGGVPGDVVLTILVSAMAGDSTVSLDAPIRVSR
jgi:DNA polymerase-3 subunit delta